MGAHEAAGSVDGLVAIYRQALPQSRGDLRLVLSAPSGPNSGGGSVLADGRPPSPADGTALPFRLTT